MTGSQRSAAMYAARRQRGRRKRGPRLISAVRGRDPGRRAHSAQVSRSWSRTTGSVRGRSIYFSNFPAPKLQLWPNAQRKKTPEHACSGKLSIRKWFCGRVHKPAWSQRRCRQIYANVGLHAPDCKARLDASSFGSCRRKPRANDPGGRFFEGMAERNFFASSHSRNVGE